MHFIVIGVALVLGGWSLAHLLLRRLPSDHGVASATMSVQVTHEPRGDLVLAQATTTARAGDWRMAVRHTVSALLVRLHTQAGVAFDAALTRAEVRRRLRAELAQRAESGATC